MGLPPPSVEAHVNYQYAARRGSRPSRRSRAVCVRAPRCAGASAFSAPVGLKTFRPRVSARRVHGTERRPCGKAPVSSRTIRRREMFTQVPSAKIRGPRGIVRWSLETLQRPSIIIQRSAKIIRRTTIIADWLAISTHRVAENIQRLAEITQRAAISLRRAAKNIRVTAKSIHRPCAIGHSVCAKTNRERGITHFAAKISDSCC